MTELKDSALPLAPLSGGPVLCMDIDGVSAPTGTNARFDAFAAPQGFVRFDVDDFPLNVHPALPDWFDELSDAYTHCAWVSSWGQECARFARGAGLCNGAAWPYLEAPYGGPIKLLRYWEKLDAVVWWVDPDVPVAVVDDHMAPQGFSTVDEHILQAIEMFLARPGPTLLIAPAQEIGLTRPIVDLLCWFARHPHDPKFSVRSVHRMYPDFDVRWPDPLPPGLEEPVLNRNEE